MLFFNANQLNSLHEIFVTVLILYPTLIFLAFRAYLLEPPPQDYITKGKTMKKSQNSNEVKNGCTRSRIRIVLRSSLLYLLCEAEGLKKKKKSVESGFLYENKRKPFTPL